MKNNDAFDIARAIAGKTDPMVTHYFHSSVILDRRGRIIGRGRNHFTGNQIVIPDSDEPLNKTIHSEVHALTKVNIRRLQDATIINYARTNVRTIISKPCASCWAILKKLEFRKVFYSLESTLSAPLWQEEGF